MIYIQTYLSGTRPEHFDAACAMYGAIDNGNSYRLTAIEKVSAGKFDKLIRQNLFVGSVEFMRAVFSRVGISGVRVPLNSNRESKVMTLSQAQEIAGAGRKLFIKPIDIKLFTGFVIDGCRYTALQGLPGDTPILAYEPFPERIGSEWRCYIHNHRLADSRNYAGDFRVSPDYGYVEQVIKTHKSQFPCAYTIDVATFAGQGNTVVEFNDMWAIGNYGIPNDIYLRMLKDRYFEIMRSQS